MDISRVVATLQVTPGGAPAGPGGPVLQAGQSLQATVEALLPGVLVLRLADGRLLQAQGSLPFPPGSALVMKALPLPQGAGLRLQVLQATPPAAPALLAPLLQGEAAGLLARLHAGGPLEALDTLLRGLLATPGAAEDPAAWKEWLKASLEALADPAASPAEAPFHRLQAQEGTGFFEVPLPWAPGAGPLQVWVEADRDAGGRGADPARRVLISVAFTALGEVRAGFDARASGLRVRLWLADPGALEPLRPALEAELKALGRPVDLKLLPLPAGAPDLRALAGGPGLEALG